MKIRIENTIAVGIDYQERLIPAINENDEVIRSSRILLAGLELLEVPVIITRQYPKGLGDTVEAIRQASCKARVLDKNSFSCYEDPGIKEALDASGRKNVIVCGTEAHICALQTTISLQEAGYQAVYVTDCVGSRKANDKKFGIKRAAQEGALLTTYEALLFELMGGTASPAFKEISNLVK